MIVNTKLLSMDFRYFKGPPQDMSQLLDGAHTCSICGNESSACFSLEYTITDIFPDEVKEDKIGCFQCLREGKFEFWHDTEYGMLTKKDLRNSTSIIWTIHRKSMKKKRLN